jgi:hypothetical protein
MDNTWDDHRFVDIKIDSESETETNKPCPKNNNHLFSFSNNNNNNKKKFSINNNKNQIKEPKNKSFQLNTNRNIDCDALKQKTDLLLANLSAVGIKSSPNFVHDDDDDDEDDDYQDDEDILNADHETSIDTLIKSTQLKQFNYLNSTANLDFVNHLSLSTSSSTGDILANSTPLNSNSLNCIEKVSNLFDFNPKIDDTTLAVDLLMDNGDETLEEEEEQDVISNQQNELNKILNQSRQSENSSKVKRFHSVNNSKSSGTHTQILKAVWSLNNNQPSINTSMIKNDSLVDGLLGDIYDRFNISFKESFDSDVFTEFSISSCSRFSDSAAGHESENKYKLAKSYLQHLCKYILSLILYWCRFIEHFQVRMVSYRL